MESKSMKDKNFIKLLINEILEKKNWFIISFVTIFITAVLVPMLMYKEITEAGVAIAVFELFVVVFFNCIIDFSYLHDSRKFSYYMSKPIKDIDKINVIIISNIIFASIFMLFIAVISVFCSNSMLEMFIVVIPWMLVGIFLAALSSILVGNSIVAVFATVFNFLVPLSILAVVYYIFYLIQTVATGFSSDILMDVFIEKYYRIGNLYFVEYASGDFNASYFAVLIGIIAFVYLLTRRLLAKRQNERIGEFVVFSGYENFISILISSLIPIAFLVIERDMGFLSQIVAFVILASLSYYIILVVLEKSFKVRKGAIRVLAVFIGIFLIFVGAANLGVKNFESYIPPIDEVKSVYIGNSTWIYSEYMDKSIRIYDLDENIENKYSDILIYTDKESIAEIMELHKRLIADDKYKNYQNISLLYKLKSGRNVVRYYSLETDETYSGDKDDRAKNIIKSEEYKKGNFGFIYDDEFSESLKVVTVSYNDGYYENKKIDMNKIDINKLREALRKDYDKSIEDTDYSLEWLTNPQNAISASRYRYEDSLSYDEKTSMVKSAQPTSPEYYIILEVYGKKAITYYFDDSFKNTIKYMENFI